MDVKAKIKALEWEEPMDKDRQYVKETEMPTSMSPSRCQDTPQRTEWLLWEVTTLSLHIPFAPELYARDIS